MGLLSGHSAPENLQSVGLDPDPVLDDPDQPDNSAAGQQNHLKVSRMCRREVEGDQSDTQTDEPAGDKIWLQIRQNQHEVIGFIFYHFSKTRNTRKV